MLSIPKSESFKIFDSIADRYDFINGVLSLGLHTMWRKRVRESLPSGHNQKVLDLATGTADVAIELTNDRKVASVDGLDMSQEMIKLGDTKIKSRNLQDKIKLRHGDAMTVPAKDCTYNAVTMAFGIRNVRDVEGCLRECYRVLKPGGRVLMLEFALPDNQLFKRLHLGYLRHVLPKIGKVLSGHSFAYKYLNETIETFPYGDDFVALLDKSGFENTKFSSLSFGIVNLYRGDKV